MFIITRTGFFLQTPLSLTHSLIDWVGHPLPPDHQNIASKPLEQESWTFDRLFTHHHVSCVTCHLSCVTPHLSHFILKKNIYIKKYKKNTPSIFVYNAMRNSKVCQFWRYFHEILGCRYAPNQGEVEEP